MKTVRATSKIQLTVEIDTPSTWGETCQIGQIYKQSKDAAINALRNSIENKNILIIGTVKIISVMVESE